MIRPLFVVKRQPLLRSDIEKRLEPIADSFALYLSLYRTEKSRDSKHGKLGPVGKVLSRMKAGRRGSSVVGEAIRFHEMSAASMKGQAPSINPNQFQALEEAILGLSQLLEDPLVTAADHNRILSAAEHKVYYKLEKRRKFILFEGQEKFVLHLQQKYGSLENLKAAWDEAIESWERVPYPSKNVDRFENEAIREDVKQYLAQGNVATANEMDEEEVQDADAASV